MDKEKEILDEDLISSVDIDNAESIEEHYSKMYKDLPPEVVKMLISTHPLYGDKSESSKDKEKLKHSPKENLEDTVVLKEKIKQPETITEKTEIKKEPTKEVEKIEEKVEILHKKKPIDEDYEEDDEIEEEREFLYSLFPKKDGKEYNIDFKKYITIGILTTSLLVCIIGMTVNAIQNKADKALIADLKTEKDKYTRTLNNLEVEKQFISDENASLKKENENLKAEIASLNAQTEQEPPVTDNNNNTPTDDNSTNTTPQKPKTHTVAKGESLWVISQKVYGSGKYYTEIMKANNLKDDKAVKEGMTLILPDIK